MGINFYLEVSPPQAIMYNQKNSTITHKNSQSTNNNKKINSI